MNELIINQIKQEIAAKEEAIKNFEKLRNEVAKLKEALFVLESKSSKTRDENESKAEKKSKTRHRVSRKELDKVIVEESISTALQQNNKTISVGEIRNKIFPMQHVHGGMNSLGLYNRVYLVLSKRSDLFQKSEEGWTLKDGVKGNN